MTLEKNPLKKSTAAQTLLARVDCSIFNLDLKLLLSCNRSFADYLEDRLIDAVNSVSYTHLRAHET